MLREGRAFCGAEKTLLLILQPREKKKLFRGENYKKSVWELIAIIITQKIKTFAHDLSRLKENGKLAFKKYFDLNICRKMFKWNDLCTNKSMAVIPEMEKIGLSIYGRNNYSRVLLNIFLFWSKVN